MEFDEIKSLIKEYKPDADTSMLELAYEFAAEKYKGQVRKNGEPLMEHCLAVAYRLAKIRMDEAAIIGGLLHEVLDEADVSIQELEKQFGDEIARLVAGVSMLGNLKYRGIERYAENLRKMFVDIARDIRIILIKFADRYHNLETLNALSSDKQYRIAREVMEIYVPIADRLGIWYMKSKLEDLAFPYVHPDEFFQTSEIVNPHRIGREAYLENLKTVVLQRLEDHGITLAVIEQRVKSLYSVYRKMLKKGSISLDGIYDVVAMRIIVSSIADCYAALGAIHQHWKPLPRRMKDYIAQPKPNNYRALHTTVFCEKGEVVEFQIQTAEMHAEAKYGIAAHWNYDEARKISRSVTKNIEWLQDIVSLWNEENPGGEESMHVLTLDIFKHRIFVFTPKGDVINLPEDATPIDFAFAIHSDLGRRCAGAKINTQLQSIDTKLRSGDVVEIIFDKNRRSPSPDWLAYAKTALARAKIRSQLRETERL
ncbi:bifunctional (p)ppGpp synthetase/guanosine-3',5'-bis(diphosphate) 3'-pyrophosphohydrolase [Candidatus Uhrbacteria bacterium]|nr:bifunctional (p)ppGpp synthetase/guanosine-3',5'-bis(diphosphate) 3'-pyrophosphohydrolase [Candidatus Uhrbacteria bacterium]